ncbi:MAG: Cellulose synthesis regulatory protein [Nocardioidaceae bacterium]|jgi:diguanylate cyclase (GGDEF)-like protein|nr:Cellulose synthesis regulatory protein [Nocardioidaceae bacterium]
MLTDRLPPSRARIGGADQQGRNTARLDAHRLVQRVQTGDYEAEVQASLESAEKNGWSEVVRVLLYADLVRVWVRRDADPGTTIQRLYERAERDGDPVMLAAALASRAEYQYESSSATVRERANRDLARAVALLRAGGGGALERGTAFIDCGLAYRQRELWELEEQMYACAAATLPDCEEPLLEGALRLNQTVVRVHQACGLREIGEFDALRLLGRRSAAASTWSDLASDGFGVEERVARHLLARLLDESPREASAALDHQLTVAQHPGELPEHGMLRLADALHAAQEGDWAQVAEQTATAMTLLGNEVGPPVIALTLRLAAQAGVAGGSPGIGPELAYGDWSARRRWDARQQLLSAARAGLETEQLRVERDEHAHQAHVDELTGLANRRGYTRHAQRIRSRGSTIAALLVDVDAFKAVNDTFGHTVGDSVLVLVSSVLSTGIRPGDLVARLGGDEFVVLLDRVDAASARARAADTMARLALVDWARLATGLDVTISIGVAAGPGSDPEEILLRADRALYQSKARGGGDISVAIS